MINTNPQVAAFMAQVQSGQEMSMESLFGVTLIFSGQGNPGGYDASSGRQIREMFVDQRGVMMEQVQKAFRIRRELLANDGISIVPEVTTLSQGGKSYRVLRTIDQSFDTCLYLGCKEL